jgi:hypothetical protein
MNEIEMNTSKDYLNLTQSHNTIPKISQGSLHGPKLDLNFKSFESQDISNDL